LRVSCFLHLPSISSHFNASFDSPLVN